MGVSQLHDICRRHGVRAHGYWKEAYVDALARSTLQADAKTHGINARPHARVSAPAPRDLALPGLSRRQKHRHDAPLRDDELRTICVRNNMDPRGCRYEILERLFACDSSLEPGDAAGTGPQEGPEHAAAEMAGVLDLPLPGSSRFEVIVHFCRMAAYELQHVCIASGLKPSSPKQSMVEDLVEHCMSLPPNAAGSGSQSHQHAAGNAGSAAPSLTLPDFTRLRDSVPPLHDSPLRMLCRLHGLEPDGLRSDVVRRLWDYLGCWQTLLYLSHDMLCLSLCQSFLLAKFNQ